jgi:A/G-specific adenine glycosylase
VSVKIVKNLSRWFQDSARDLPWRRDPSPYAVWLSEIMLQQTRVATVIPYYERFMAEFPDVTALADAPLERVLKLWAGLGYYSRARNLHRGAQAIRDRILAGSGFPESSLEWRSVPGVGPYTAGAVASIVNRERAAVVDGNVVRVLSRIHAIRTVDSGKTLIWEHSRKLVMQKDADPRVLNQALMELGAMVCLPKNPKCNSCPVRSSCKGKADPHSYPQKAAPKKWKRVEERKWVLLRNKGSVPGVYLVQNPKGAWREGLWDFPAPVPEGISSGTLLAGFRLNYVVTCHKVERAHQVFQMGSAKQSALKGGKWFALKDPPGVPAPVRKALSKIESILRKLPPEPVGGNVPGSKSP